MPDEQVPAPPSFTNRVAREIRAELGRQNQSQTWLAGKLGVHSTAISKKLAGTNPITLDDLDRIAGALGVPVEGLCGAHVPAGAA